MVTSSWVIVRLDLHLFQIISDSHQSNRNGVSNIDWLLPKESSTAVVESNSSSGYVKYVLGYDLINLAGISLSSIHIAFSLEPMAFKNVLPGQHLLHGGAHAQASEKRPVDGPEVAAFYAGGQGRGKLMSNAVNLERK